MRYWPPFLPILSAGRELKFCSSEQEMYNVESEIYSRKLAQSIG